MMSTVSAAIYARKSTDQVGVQDAERSVTRQDDHARVYAAQNGWSVADEHIFVDDGISGAELAQRPMAASRAAALLLAALAIAWPCRSAAQEPAVGPPLRPLVLESPAGQRFRVVPVATGLEHPWSLAFLPGGRSMLVTERPGRLRLIRDDGLDPRPIAGVPDVYAEHLGGLNEVALHPEFARNGLVYLSYSKAGARGATLALARGRFDGTQLVDVHDIFVADAWEPAGPTARGGGGTYGGRMAFGAGGMLYLTVADRDTMVSTGNPDVRMRAQNLGDHVGKVLRLRDDGTVPDDNPFVGQPGARPEIYTYGHRNAYGLAFHPDTGALWELEIGPLAGDEVNILVPGGELRLAARVARTRVQRPVRVRAAVVAPGHRDAPHLLGAGHQPVGNGVLHRRPVSRLAGKPFRQRARVAAAPADRVQRRDAHRTARVAAHRDRPAVPGRAAGARWLPVRLDRRAAHRR